ncbi:MAG: MFS transporter [Thermoplasmata archaeon]
MARCDVPGGGAAAESTYRELLRNRNYFRVFSAGLGSVAGSTIATVCLVWIVAVDTGSALDVALLGTASLVAAIAFSTLGGTLVDRYDRRRLMILSDVTRALALAAVVVVFVLRGFNLPVLLVAEGVIGAFTVLFNPAEQAIVPALVPEHQVADANGLVRSSRSSLQFVGASVGGVLIVTLGPLWGVGVNAATFALSAALLTGLVIAPRAGATIGWPGATSYLAELRAGFRWLWRARAFFQLTMSAMFFNFCSTVIGTFLVFYATDVLHGSALVYAALLAAEVAGTAIGSLLVGRLGAARYAGKAWVVPYGVVSGLVALALALAPSVPTAIAVLFALGTLGGFAGTAWLTAAQLLVPTEMQGRYFGIDGLGSYAILPAAQIGGAFLIGAFATRTTYLLAAVVWVVAGVAFLAPRALWRLGVRPGEAVTFRSGGGGAGTSESPGGTRLE